VTDQIIDLLTECTMTVWKKGKRKNHQQMPPKRGTFWSAGKSTKDISGGANAEGGGKIGMKGGRGQENEQVNYLRLTTIKSG